MEDSDLNDILRRVRGRSDAVEQLAYHGELEALKIYLDQNPGKNLDKAIQYAERYRRVEVLEYLTRIKSNLIESKTTVVCIAKKKAEYQPLIDSGKVIYCGRDCHMGGWRLGKSKWANPFKGDNAVADYYKWIHGNLKDLKGKSGLSIKDDVVRELKGRILACWCKNKDEDKCHCDVLVYLADGYAPEYLKTIISSK